MLATPGQTPFAAPEIRALIYRLDDVEFATPVSQVQELIRPTAVARLPGLPAHIEGFIKRRGLLTPIIDLRRYLRFPVNPLTPETCVLIARFPMGPVGFVIDAALALRRIRRADFATPSPILARIEKVYIQGLAVQADRVMVMLDLLKVLSAQEQSELAGVL